MQLLMSSQVWMSRHPHRFDHGLFWSDHTDYIEKSQSLFLLHMQDAEGENDGSLSVMDELLNKLTEVLLLEGQESQWSFCWLLRAFCTQ